VRAYDDGVALRSRLAAKAGRRINGESRNGGCRAIRGVVIRRIRELRGSIPEKPAGDCPRAISFPCDNLHPAGWRLCDGDGGESSELRQSRSAGGHDHSLRATFHSIPANQNGWTSDEAVVQPWRVTLLARDLNALANSDLIEPLSRCNTGPGETDWMRPAAPRGNGGQAAARFTASSINGWIGPNNSF